MHDEDIHEPEELIEAAEGEPRRLLQLGLPVLAAAGTFSALGLARGRFEHSQLFNPERYPLGEWRPETLGLPAQDVWFSVDGLDLHGWWVPAEGALGTLLYCHGNSGSIGQRVEILRHLHRLPVNVFAYDYRGYGRSEGRPSEAGLFRDARAAYRFLVDELGCAPHTVILLGHSMGGAVAIDAALELPVPGVIIEAAFTGIRDMARNRFGRLPMHWIARNQFHNIGKIGSVRPSKLFIHGTADTTVPVEMSRQLFAAAVDPKQLLEIEGAEHNDLHLLGGELYADTLRDFVSRCVDAAA